MSLKHGILGFLSQWPNTTGYDLKKDFDSHMNMIWFSHLSQIYPELNKLEKEDLILSKTIKQEGKPNKKTYTITEKGMQELIYWVSKPPKPPKIKDSFLMQTYFMDKVSLEEATFLLRTYQKEREERLSALRNLIKKKFKDLHQSNSPITARIIMGISVYKKGMDQEKNYIQWCEETINILNTFSPLWTGKGDVEWVKLDNPETSGLQSVPFLPFKDVEKLLYRYFGEELNTE